MLTRIALIIAPVALLATACGTDAPPAGNEDSFTSQLVGTVDISGDTDVELRQFTFTDLDGVRQKCFLFSGTRGSVSCQAVADNR